MVIIGGTGRMGTWFARFFKNAGLNVTIAGRSQSKSSQIAAQLEVDATTLKDLDPKRYDLVFLSTPIRATAYMVRQLAKRMAEGATIAEIASIKGEIGQALAEAHRKYGIKAVSLHPMFGPGAENIKGQKIIVIPVENCEDAARTMNNFLKEAGAVTLWLKSFEEHDRFMALVLALPRLINTIFAEALKTSHVPLLKIVEFGGTTFRFQKIVCQSIFQEEAEMYAAIQALNPEFSKIVAEIEKLVKQLKKTVKSGDIAYLKRLHRQASRYLSRDPEYPEAYKKFYLALKAMG